MMDCCCAEKGGGRQGNNPRRAPLLERISLAVTGRLEGWFYRWGLFVSTHPWKFILGAFTVTALMALGFINFTQENRPDKLWIPRDSKFASDTEWLRRNFPSPLRESFLILTVEDGGNVLTSGVIREIFRLHESVKEISIPTNGRQKMTTSDENTDEEGDYDKKKWKDLCFKLPITKFPEASKYSQTRRRRNIQSNSNDSHSLFGDTFSAEKFGSAFDDPFFHDDDIKEDEVEGEASDPTVGLPMSLYCSIINSLEEACWEMNPAELWEFNKSTIYNLTDEDVVNVFNHRLTSPIFGRTVNYTSHLGGRLQYNDKGEIISAESIRLTWVLAINQTAVDLGLGKSDFSTGETTDEDTWLWEKAWTELMENVSKSMPRGMNIYYANGRSWGDITESLIFEDGMMLVVGFFVMFLYISLMIGKFNMVEQRPLLSICAIVCVGFAVIVAHGIGSMCFLLYGPVNKILPFMLLGIGIDDTFVIMQCWGNLYPSEGTGKRGGKKDSPPHPLGEGSTTSGEKKEPIPERMGRTLQHAGVSITVTSITDIAAFGVGASTIMPGLQSFCVYAAIGVIAVYLLQTTFFVACFALDQQRLEARRNGCFPWIQYQENVSMTSFVKRDWSQKSYFQSAFDFIFIRMVLSTVGKVMVIVMTISFLGVSIYGNILLKQEFDPIWFLPDDSHLAKYIGVRESFYPGTGHPAFIVAENVNWTASLETYDKFSREFKASDAIYSFENWYDDFKRYANNHFKRDIPRETLDSKTFQKYMGKFLYSPIGSKHRGFFKLQGNRKFACGESLPSIEMVMMPFRFQNFHGAEEHIPGMREVKRVVANVNLTFNDIDHGGKKRGRMIPWSPAMVTWETDELITEELYRNVIFSFLCVMASTFVLLANIRVCLLCGLCVIFTLINVGGMMHFWGLTIDMISFIDIVLAVGLVVDYAAHIALAFMASGDSGGKNGRRWGRSERAEEAVRKIGPAVLNGGFSTFLAILLLANSQSHAFKSFFKIFTVVIIFGLFHGLCFLPVLLSLIGPEPFNVDSPNQEIDDPQQQPAIDIIEDKKGEVDDPPLIIKPHQNGVTNGHVLKLTFANDDASSSAQQSLLNNHHNNNDKNNQQL